MLGYHVYLFEIEPGIFKLGSSKNYGHRFAMLAKDLQRNLRFVRAWNEPDYSYRIEIAAHRILRPFRCKDFGGTEIYKTSEAKMIRAVREAKAKIVGCKPITIKRRKEMWAAGKTLQLPVSA